MSDGQWRTVYIFQKYDSLIVTLTALRRVPVILSIILCLWVRISNVERQAGFQISISLSYFIKNQYQK